MKRLFLFMFLFPSVGMAQVEDSTCIYARWIQLRPGKVNSDIFCLDSNLSIEKDFINYLKKAVETNKINIYSEKRLEDGSSEWLYIDYHEEMQEAKMNSENKNNWSPYFSRIGPDQDTPFVDEFGDPVIITDETGGLHFVYPEREVYPLRTSDIDQIVIKEVRNFNKKASEPDFIPSDIGFFIKDKIGKRPGELFWVNMEDLRNLVTEEDNYSWFPSINNVNYKGTLVRQTTCEYMDVNASEFRHPVVLDISDSCTCSVTTHMIKTQNHYMIKIPNHCKKGINVYFGMGGTQTNINILELSNDLERFYGRFSIANKGDKEYMTFDYRGTFLVQYSPCHWYREFKITIY